MDNINFKKVLDDGELFDQQANYEENFEKINQEVVPKITDLETNKVDKVTGKGLSTNDYTTTEKNKLAGIPADTATQLSGKVDKVTGKGLSTNDFDNTYKQKIDTDIPAQLAEKVQVGNRVVLGEEEFELVKILEHQSALSYTIDVGDGFVIQGSSTEGYSKYDYDLNRLWVYFQQTTSLGLGFGSDSSGNIYIPTQSGIEVINNLGVYQKTINQGVRCICLNIDKANNVIYHDYNGAFRKSDLDGNLIWEDTTRDDLPRAIELLNNGKIVTGRHSTTNSTICYNGDGTVYWVSNNPHRVVGITSDDESNVYVIGSNSPLAKLRYNNGVMVWTNTSISGYHERSQISKDNSGNVYVSNFTTGYSSFFAKVDMGSGKIITQNSFGTRHNMIKFINRNLIIVSRAISSGGDYMTAVYRLKNDVLGVL